MRTGSARFTLSLVSGVALGAALVALPIASAQRSDPYAWFDPVIDVQRIISERFVTEPDMQGMQRGAIDGMIESLDDRYTVYIPNVDVAEFNKDIRGEYVGIGAVVQFEDGYTTIVTPMDDSPALKAGLMPGDRVIAVDGKSAAGVDTDGVVDMLVGEPGTTVRITVGRDGEQFDVDVVRQEIRTRTVAGIRRVGGEWDYMLDTENKIGYLRLSQFNADSPDEVLSALRQMQEQGAEGLIFDLRFNPGGQLRSAVQIADLFLTEGVIVSTRGRAYPEQVAYATNDAAAPDIPLLLLVNGRSASGSEVVAAALKDNGRAQVIGTRTFGKGVTQGVISLPSGAGQLKITEQYYYGPSGDMINREEGASDWGIDPNAGFFVAMTDREYADMLRARGQADIIRNGGADPLAIRSDESTDDWIQRVYNDRQLAMAARAMRSRLSEGDWVPVGDENDIDAPKRDSLATAERARERLLRELDRIDQRVSALEADLGAEADSVSLIPDTANLVGGRVQITDAEGNVVATLRIIDDGLESWLVDAPVERENEE